MESGKVRNQNFAKAISPVCQQWVRGKEPMVDVAMRKHAVNDSATPQSETMQMTYRVLKQSMEQYPRG